MKKISFIIAMLFCTAAYSQLNITLRSHLPFPVGTELSNIGGYVDSLGNEYALVGWSSGLRIIDVTNPDSVFVKQNISGPNSSWREVKTWSHYGYVTTEGGGGLQIINFSNLPGTVTSKQWTGDGAILGQLGSIHALHIDNNGYIYLYGSNLFNGAAVIASLTPDPWNPHYLGHTTGNYIHDGYAYGDTLWSCHIYNGYFGVWDVTNKANPVLLQTHQTPGNFTHNSWLNDEHTVLFTTDEVSGSYLTSYDITDLSDIKELSRIQLTPGSGSIVHNTHTLNDYEVVSWYKDGIAIVDASRPDNMIITGYYDTYPSGSGDGFNGAWGVYPYLPSGNLLVSDIDNGLFVLTPSYVRGCYLEGNVKDSTTGAVLNGVNVSIVGQNISKLTDLAGNYKTGVAVAGTYDIQFTKVGYYPLTVTGVALTNGVLVNLDVALIPLSTITLTGLVHDVFGNPLPGALVSFQNALITYDATTDVNGEFSISNFIPDNYNVFSGNWGYITTCNYQSVSSGPLHFFLNRGYFDDFSLDFGWTSSGTSNNNWERAVPVATFNGIEPANPGNDAAGDCGTYALVTDNGGGGPWDHDVDFGEAIITSPAFNALIYNDPYLNYTRWYYNGGTVNGAPNDTMKVFLDNGTSSVLVETANPSTPDNSTWADRHFRISDYITPTATMRMKIVVRDSFPVNNIVEGGLDKFSVTEGPVAVETINNIELSLSSMPNPFSSQVTINYNTGNVAGQLILIDVTGKEIERRELNGIGKITTGKNWPGGIYFARLVTNVATKTLRLNKVKEYKE